MSVNGKTRKELLSLPVRDWSDTEKRYDSILVLAEGKKHESGWGVMAIIGCVGGEPVEIASRCADDIGWKFKGNPRTDCALPSRALHFWYHVPGCFQVGAALSSTDVLFDPSKGAAA